MMKKIHKSAVIILLLLMTFGNKAIAQTPFHLINKSGTLYSFYLEDKPRFWHQGGLLHIHTDKTKINFVLAKVAQILWDNDIPTSIQECVENRVRFNISSEKLTISGNPDSVIRIYSLKGILCAEVQPTGEESITIDISELQQGTYLVKISDFTFKFMKQ